MYTYADDTREAGGMMIGNHVRFYDENHCVEEERLPGELRQAAQRRSHRAIDNASSDLPRVTGRQSQQQLLERGFEPSTAALTPSTPVQRLSAGQVSHTTDRRQFDQDFVARSVTDKYGHFPDVVG